jgi:glutamate racemase
VAKEYLEPLIKEKVDTIILGCTHYPLLKKIISKIVGIKVNLIDPGEQAAKTLKQLLSENNLRSEQKQGDCFYVSDSTENFSQYASLFLGKDVNECVKKINIEDY